MQWQSRQQLKFQALLAERAHFMRHNLTDTEQILWHRIAGKQLGVAFRRQVPVGRYVADFVAPAAMLIVEVDDRSHELRRTADARRDRNLGRLGYRVLRIPAALVRAIVHAESAFDPTAVSQVGASGLMQLMPDTAERMFVRDIFEPRENIEGGTRYLRVLANMYGGDMVKMIAAYNAGPAAVDRAGGAVPALPETQAYVRKVIALYFQYKAQQGPTQDK